jgi:hypothetical protein
MRYFGVKNEGIGEVGRSYLALETSDDEAMQQLHGHSINYRIAIGPHQGRKVFA